MAHDQPGAKFHLDLDLDLDLDLVLVLVLVLVFGFDMFSTQPMAAEKLEEMMFKRLFLCVNR